MLAIAADLTQTHEIERVVSAAINRFGTIHVLINNVCLYLMGLNLSTHQIAQELDLNKDDAQQMITQLRLGIVEKKPLRSSG